MASTHDEFDDFFNDDDDKPIADTRADGRLFRVPLGRLSPNLVNPRTDFGTEDQLIDLGKSLARRQNQPCPVVSRVAYLKLWPDHVDKIGDVDYVLVSGERRYRSATVVGLHGLDCVANDDFARDRRTFMEAVVSENVDRQNFDPIEEAYAVQALVTEFGSNRAVAQHFERVDGWVTQRVLLTHLAREVQDLVRSKSMPLEAARTLGKQVRDKQWDASQQLAWWEAEQESRTAAAAARSVARKAARQQPTAPLVQPEFYGRKTPAGEHLGGSQDRAQKPESFTAVKPDPDPKPTFQAEPADAAAPPVERTIPDPREEPSDGGAGEQTIVGRKFPYDDGLSAASFLNSRMPDDEFVVMVPVLLERYKRLMAGRG